MQFPLIRHFFVLKMLSAFYVCCIYSNALQAYFIKEVKTMKPDQTAPFDLVSYCLQYRLPKKNKQMREQTTKVMTDGKRVNHHQHMSLSGR